MASPFRERLSAWRGAGVAALALVAAGGFAAMPFSASTVPKSLQLVGYAGTLAEWSFTAALTQSPSGELAGTYQMQHTGLCSVDVPAKKDGEMRLRFARLSSRIEATLSVDDVECRYSGSLSDAYTGLLNCPGQKSSTLTLWLR